MHIGMCLCAFSMHTFMRSGEIGSKDQREETGHVYLCVCFSSWKPKIKWWPYSSPTLKYGIEALLQTYSTIYPGGDNSVVSAFLPPMPVFGILYAVKSAEGQKLK